MPIPIIAPAVLQGITGIQQTRRSKDILKNLVRPTYNIPTAATEALGTARTLASTNQLPNQVQAEQAINQSAANALYNINQNSTSGTEALAALTGINANQMGQINNLAGQGANFAAMQEQNLINALGNYATYQDKAFEYNQNQPFIMKANEAAALAGAGMQNTFNAVNNAAGITAEIAKGFIGGGFGGGSSNFGQGGLNAGNVMQNRSMTDSQMQIAGMDANKFKNNPFASNNVISSAFSSNLTGDTLPALTPEQMALINQGYNAARFGGN